ncbi:hypothetical protein DHEL01_v202874 [Diaporthe helianthi]|uniref:Uncharacterized protein n=1 Tax=Diaporthe helianthi TaxID=158607 RepID=A0A2P5I896_DIAHE|nr:hypothetical protein DHEL01_v202874 [Diaporthe helianthi]
MAELDWNAAVIHPKQNYYRRYRVTSWPASMMAWEGGGEAMGGLKAKHAMTHQIRGGAQDLSRAPAPLLIGHSVPGTDASPRLGVTEAWAWPGNEPLHLPTRRRLNGDTIHQRAVPSWPTHAEAGQTALVPDRTLTGGGGGGGGGLVVCWPVVSGQWSMINARWSPFSSQICIVDDCFPSVRPSTDRRSDRRAGTGGSDPRKSFHLHCKDVIARLKPPASHPASQPGPAIREQKDDAIVRQRGP